LAFVDRDQIGLEGHSMGGWTVLAAAAGQPDAYRSMVLEGSSTGKPFAREGSPSWPRNLLLVYSRFDEFAPLMWGVPRALDVGGSPKLEALFGVGAPVRPGRIYGDLALGTARRLTQPVATHPGDHISREAVADAADWFALTLKGGAPRPRSDQIWWVKEAGTGLALLGLAAFGFGLFDLGLCLAPFAPLRGPPPRTRQPRDGRWWTLFLLTAFVPALSFYILPLGLPLFPPGPLLPQSITNTLMLWALINTGLSLLISRVLAAPSPARPRTGGPAQVAAAGALALLTALGLYAVVAFSGLFLVDFRFWVVALKPLSTGQAGAALVYFIPFTLFLFTAMRGVGALTAGTGRAQYVWAPACLSLGFIVLTGGQYLALFATGALPLSFEALNAIVGIQFIPLLIGLGLFLTHAYRRTGDVLAASLFAGLFVTWYMTAGTATHFA
jgi:hypothetical protein